MQQSTVSHFFLGANSRYGFYSLYDEFAIGEQDTLHIIKSGPGTGKSTFMKRIGKTAEDLGMEVEYILCSGDPYSLDGVYIPALHQGWVDGTAPHILEPKHFGIDGTYVDLGQFCQTKLLSDSRPSIINYTAAYRLCYQKAYIYLESAGKLSQSHPPLSPKIEQRIRKRAQAKIRKELSNAPERSAAPVKRFLRAISCTGNYTLTETINTLCTHICVLESHCGLESVFFDEILAEANRQQVYYILCPDPLVPERVETILFPDSKLCFTASNPLLEYQGKVRTIHLDTYLESVDKSEYKQKDRLRQQLLDAATAQLARAKRYHDELENCYRPALNTQALDEFTTHTLETIFA